MCNSQISIKIKNFINKHPFSLLSIIITFLTVILLPKGLITFGNTPFFKEMPYFLITGLEFIIFIIILFKEEE